MEMDHYHRGRISRIGVHCGVNLYLFRTTEAHAIYCDRTSSFILQSTKAGSLEDQRWHLSDCTRESSPAMLSEAVLTPPMGTKKQIQI